MRKAFYILIIVLHIPACSRNRPSVNAALERIAAVGSSRGNSQLTYSQHYREVYAELREIVGEIASPQELKELFYECCKAKNDWERPDEWISSINPYWEATNAIIFRLPELKSDEATKVLIELFMDEDIGWDGEWSLNICNAISRCGERAIPYLSEIRSERWGSTPATIADCIRKGELYGP